MKNKKRNRIFTLLIISLIVTVSGITIFLGIWFRPINVIEIYDNKDFSQKYHFPGKGTVDDPYIIEGYKLSGNGYHNIRIHGVTKYFVIRNCVLQDSNKGIDLGYLENGLTVIENNTFENNYVGILIVSSSNLLIKNNHFENNSRGIESRYNRQVFLVHNTFNGGKYGMLLGPEYYNITIQNNVFNNCSWNGIDIIYSDLVSIDGNTFSNCHIGIIAQYIQTITMQDNTAVECGYGFNVVYSENVALRKNNFTKTQDSIWASYSNNVIIEQNFCTLSDTGGLSAYGLLNAQVSNNTVVSANGNGLYIWYSYNIAVNNNSCYNNTIGMSVICSELVEITYNIFEHNLEYGLVTQGANATIWYNNFIDNDYTNISTIHSQAKVDGNCTNYVGFPQFYSNDTLQGNYWSELVWYAGVEYSIDPGSFKDKYPLENPVE
ncbi:MAG TPA: right-handed parallel beta-helix repeat-containing protein [Candidatus Bathyarchaeia archaeon]|nr:right-handed parallel beta-helix repeat-containing protein [Candidatus Bathyarchaeia archaeon]